MSSVIAAKPIATTVDETLENRQRRDQSPGAGNRRFHARHRCPQAERHRYDLRSARHPDHRPHAQAAGGGHARDLLPPRAERRLRRVHRRLHDAEAGHLPHGVRARLPQRTDRARQRHHQLLPDDPHQRLERARDRRPCSRATTRRWTSLPSPSRTPRPRSACCTPRTSAWASRGRSALRSPVVRAASISTCRRSCSRRRSTRKPARSR